MKHNLYPFTDFDKQLERICELAGIQEEFDKDEIDVIRWLLEIHCCEPVAAAERISERMGLKYEDVLKLL